MGQSAVVLRSHWGARLWFDLPVSPARRPHATKSFRRKSPYFSLEMQMSRWPRIRTSLRKKTGVEWSFTPLVLVRMLLLTGEFDPERYIAVLGAVLLHFGSVLPAPISKHRLQQQPRDDQLTPLPLTRV